MRKSKIDFQQETIGFKSNGNNDDSLNENLDNNKLFNKRSYSLRSFVYDLSSLLSFIINTKPKNKKVSKLFSERIMMSVTAVNDCIFCSWFHTKLALEVGITPKEISDIAQLNFSNKNIPEYEKVALVFAQHYAETKGYPSKKALQQLLSFYGKQTSNEIILQIKMISIGNLLGNTISAFESRIFQKTPPKNGSFLFELLIYFLGGFLFSKTMKLDGYNC